MNTDLNNEYNELIKTICAPIFKGLGFKKSSTNFYRQTTELIQTFNFQKSPWCNKSSISFTGNIGFIEPEIYLKLNQVESLTKFPKCSDSIIQFRLGLITHGTDYWYELKKRTNIDNLRIQIKKDLVFVEKLFENRKTIFSIKDYIKEITMFNPLWGEIGQYAFYKMIGNNKTALKILNKTYKEAKKPRNLITYTEHHGDGSVTEKTSSPEVNHQWVERIEQAALIFEDKLT